MDASYRLAGARAQVPLELAPFHQWGLPSGSVWALFFRLTSGYLIRFPGLADFDVSQDGGSITGHPTNATAPSGVEQLFRNHVLPLARSLRDELTLHASAVLVAQDECIAFMGESGRGKSTLAAAFSLAGHPFLTDDGLAIRRAGASCVVSPGHASIRLWQATESALVPADVERGAPLDFTSKASIQAGRRLPHSDRPANLRAIYLLGESIADHPQIAPLSPSEALATLVKHSFVLDVDDKDRMARHFADLVSLVELPIFFRLDYPRRFDGLDALREEILLHATRL